MNHKKELLRGLWVVARRNGRRPPTKDATVVVRRRAEASEQVQNSDVKQLARPVGLGFRV